MVMIVIIVASNVVGCNVCCVVAHRCAIDQDQLWPPVPKKKKNVKALSNGRVSTEASNLTWPQHASLGFWNYSPSLMKKRWWLLSLLHFCRMLP